MEMQDEMEGQLLLNSVVRKGAAIFKLLSSEEKTLLVRRDTFLVLDLHLHVVGGIRRLDLENDHFPSESLDEDLHTTTETEGKVEGKLLLDVVRKGTPVFMLFASKDEALLVQGNAVRHISGQTHTFVLLLQSLGRNLDVVICNHNTLNFFYVHKSQLWNINGPHQQQQQQRP